MIDPEIKSIIEPALRDGETVLWAERIDPELRRKWIDKKIKDGRFIAAAMLLGTGAYLLLSEAEAIIRTVLFVYFAFSALNLILSFVMPKLDARLSFRRRDSFGYALTQLRWFELDENLAIRREHQAKNLEEALNGDEKDVEIYSPFWPFPKARLYFLKDPAKSRTALQTIFNADIKMKPPAK